MGLQGVAGGGGGPWDAPSVFWCPCQAVSSTDASQVRQGGGRAAVDRFSSPGR
jgi:hypothetical protein